MCVFFAVFIMIPMLILAIFNVEYYNRRIRRVVENDLMVSATTQIKTIDNFYKEREAEVSIISQYELVKTLLKLSNAGKGINKLIEQAYLTDMFDTRAEVNEYVESISIVDKNFVVIASSAEFYEGEISDLKNLAPEYLNEELTFSGVVEVDDARGSKKIIAAIMGIYEDGEAIGYIVEEINLKFFENVRKSANLFNNGTVYILDGNGNIISAGNQMSEVGSFVTNKSERMDFESKWDKREKGGSGTIEYKINGYEYMTYYSGFENLEWQMLTTINMSEILDIKNIALHIGTIVFIVLIIVIFFGNRFVMRMLGRPIEEIVTKLKEIQKTHNYSIRMSENSSNEIGIIKTALNDLLDYIEDHINEEKRKHKSLKNEAESDPLTKLYNKAAIEKIIKNELKTSNERGRSIALIFVDIDNFKDYNSKYGHLGGDEVIKFVADVLKDSIYPVGRVGGDEFVICVNEELKNVVLKNYIEKKIGELKEGFILQKNQESQENQESNISVCCSIGVSVSSKNGNTQYNELISRADEAMYKIKNSSKNNYEIVRCS